jgi:hypothetical protein
MIPDRTSELDKRKNLSWLLECRGFIEKNESEFLLVLTTYIYPYRTQNETQILPTQAVASNHHKLRVPPKLTQFPKK